MKYLRRIYCWLFGHYPLVAKYHSSPDSYFVIRDGIFCTYCGHHLKDEDMVGHINV